MFQYDEKGVENMLLRIAVCDDEAIHRLIIRDKLDAYAISNDIDYELDEFTNSKWASVCCKKELMPRLSLQPLLSSMHRKAII